MGGLTNADMLPDRYLRWARARQVLRWIHSEIRAGRTVYLTSPLRSTSTYITPKRAARIKATREGLFVRFEGQWLSYDDASMSSK
jgi:hypothetical protein